MVSGMALVVVIRLASPVDASHRYGSDSNENYDDNENHRHLGSVLYEHEGENFCVFVTDDSISHDEAYLKITGVMFDTPPSGNYTWQQVWSIDYVGQYNCIPPDQPLEIRMYVDADGCFDLPPFSVPRIITVPPPSTV
jgi:hypothetical protein